MIIIFKLVPIFSVVPLKTCSRKISWSSELRMNFLIVSVVNIGSELESEFDFHVFKYTHL